MHLLLSLAAGLAISLTSDHPPLGLGFIGRHAVGRLPALGWNSWNAYRCDISEERVLAAAEKIVSLGLKDAGYQYVNIDDCWSVKSGRDEQTGRLVPDPDKFPNGIAYVAERVHEMGLKIGIYSDAGSHTCAGYPASLEHELVDAKTFAEWGIDYLKYDNCLVPTEWKDECSFCVPDSQHTRGPFPNGTCPGLEGFLCPDDYEWRESKTAERYRRMRDALEQVDRPIEYGMCVWGQANAQVWGNETGASWRATADIFPNWPRMMEQLNLVSFLLDETDFWGHSDADMLEVGNGELDLVQTRSHFAMWAAMKSPLLIGTDLGRISEENVAVLKNPYLLAFNQDPLVGPPAKPYRWGENDDYSWNATYPAEYWSGRTSVKLGKDLLPVDNSALASSALEESMGGGEAKQARLGAGGPNQGKLGGDGKMLLQSRFRAAVPGRPEETARRARAEGAAEDSVLILMSNWNREERQMRSTTWGEVPGLPLEVAPRVNGGHLFEVIDIWSGKSKGCYNGGYATMVDPMETVGLWVRVCR